MSRFSEKQPQIKLLVSIPYIPQAGQEISCCSTKMHILQDCVFGGKKKWEKSCRKKLEEKISFSESGGAAWLLTKQFQTVGPVLLQ